MIESALTLVAFISLFLGALDVAQMLYIHQSIVERVRLAARSAAVSCCNSDAIQNLVLYGSTVNPGANAATFWGLTTSNVAVTFANQSTAEQRVTVRVSGLTYRTYTPMMAGTFTNIPVQITIPLEMP